MNMASSLIPNLPKKDPSTMCEFRIRGDEKFVYDCLELILSK